MKGFDLMSETKQTKLQGNNALSFIYLCIIIILIIISSLPSGPHYLTIYKWALVILFFMKMPCAYPRHYFIIYTNEEAPDVL